jgi:hypothetical protein
MTLTINYFSGQNGVVFFDDYASDIEYVHENDGDLTGHYMENVLSIIQAELQEHTNFNSLHERVKQTLYDLEDTTAEDYE